MGTGLPVGATYLQMPYSLSFLLICTLLCATASAADERQAFFGDLHIHTQNSADAFLFNSRTTPDDAYRYAQGKTIQHPSGFSIRLAGGPLDFAAVTDHGELLGVLTAMTDIANPESASPLGMQLSSKDRAEVVKAYFAIMADVAQHGTDSKLRDPRVIRSAWQATIDAAQRHNRPGTFTTFIGYEYSSAPENQNLHRNVLFASAQVPEAPFSAVESPNPEALWIWLDELRARGIDGLAIPHNANVSNGLMFQPTTFEGGPIDPDYAERRMRNEPLVEVSQVKGTSETHPLLSPNDEWAGFELYDNLIASPLVANKKGGFVRDAYRLGVELESSEGFNPFTFGLIGSTDTHNAGGPIEEQSFFGKVGTLDGTAAQRGSVPSDTKARFGSDNAAHAFSQWGAAGIAGVWAERNTRQSLFAAMRRKETFATSGPRIRLRFFAGFGYDEGQLHEADMLDQAYRFGVPMGGHLIGSTRATPSFLLWATRDSAGANLQRLQIVKGWVEYGKSHERVFDVACAGAQTPDPQTHRCPAIRAPVNLTDCSYAQDKGAAELRAQWRDPSFQSQQLAFYYVRALELPTCRWSSWDALRAGVSPNPDLPATIQERAWSSPIWYRPGK